MHDCIIHLGDDIETFSLSPCLGQVDCTLKNDSSGNWDRWEKVFQNKKRGTDRKRQKHKTNQQHRGKDGKNDG